MCIDFDVMANARNLEHPGPERALHAGVPERRAEHPEPAECLAYAEGRRGARPGTRHVLEKQRVERVPRTGMVHHLMVCYI